MSGRFRAFLAPLLLAFMAIVPMQANAATDAAATVRRALDRQVPALLAAQRVPSVSIAVIRHGEPLVAAAYGMRAPGERATAGTLYNLASLTKPISAEVVLRLVAAGRLSLDAPMATDWVDPDLRSDPRHRLLTPRMALSHKTGFPNWRRETGGVLRFIGEPGATIGYSGEGYEYVATFAARRMGMPIDRLARRYVLGPSHMGSTAYTRQRWFAGRIAQPSTGGRFMPPQFTAEPIASDLAYSTASDYARFLVGLLRGEGLTPELLVERTRVQADRTAQVCNSDAKRATCPQRVGFGLGWEVLQFGGDRFLMHTGADTGLFTFAYFSPGSGEGAVVLTNGDEGGSVVLPILEAVGADPRFLAYLRAQIDG